MKNITRILVVEDERIIANDIKDSLESFGYDVLGIMSSGEKAIHMALETHPDLILMDIRLKGDIDGIMAAEHIQAQLDVPIVYLTAHTDDMTFQRAKITTPSAYLLKPFEDRELQLTIEMALYKHQTDLIVKESERWLATTLKNIGEGVITTDAKGRINLLNPLAENLTGWQYADAIDRDLDEVFQLVDNETGELLENLPLQALREGVMVNRVNQSFLSTKDDVIRPIDFITTPIQDEEGFINGIALVFQDITERQQAEGKIRLALREKEVLLKEVYHRVKNNMQIITSLLSLQASSIEDEIVREQIRDSQNRIHSMALVHESLYQSQNLSQIQFVEYARRLTHHLLYSYRAPERGVAVSLDAPEDIYLTLDIAIPAGLIIHELVSNALKHAFPNGRSGQVQIQLDRIGAEDFVLTISDDGIGLPEEIGFQNTTTLGLQLVHNLSRQLNGTLDLQRTNGTSVILTFAGPSEWNTY